MTVKRSNPNIDTYQPETSQPADTFDVTCVIGKVVIGWESSETVITTPYEAAMLLIARHDAPGVYTFPMPSGGVTQITVEYFDNPDKSYDPDGPGARNKVSQVYPDQRPA
jgi:hypothetical protein